MVALLLMAHDIDPSVNLRTVARQAFDAPELPSMWDDFRSDAGYWKGAAQMLQGMVFGVGLYDEGGN